MRLTVSIYRWTKLRVAFGGKRYVMVTDPCIFLLSVVHKEGHLFEVWVPPLKSKAQGHEAELFEDAPHCLIDPADSPQESSPP